MIEQNFIRLFPPPKALFISHFPQDTSLGYSQLIHLADVLYLHSLVGESWFSPKTSLRDCPHENRSESFAITSS